jgi:hypothetical protein
MTTWANVQNNIAIEVVTTDPKTIFTPQIASLFSPVPDGTLQGATLSNGVWTNPVPPAPPAAPPPPPPPTLTPMEFYIAFTPAERILLKALTVPGGIPAFSPILGGNGTSGGNAAAIPQDMLITEFWATYQLAAETNSPIDMSLNSIQEGLAYLASPSAPTPVVLGVDSAVPPATRVTQISQGISQ